MSLARVDYRALSTALGKQPAKGWVFYDGACDLCRRLAVMFAYPLRHAGFEMAPLQARGVQEHLGLSEETLLFELKVVLASGEVSGGADAVIVLAKISGWTWPLSPFSRIPGMKWVLRYFYRKVADSRSCSPKSVRR